MNPIILHPILFYFIMGFNVLLMIIVSIFIYKWIMSWFYDYLIFIDSSNRWKMVKTKLKDLDTFDHENKKYFLNDEDGLLNSMGKLLYVFSVNKPKPMQITYNTSKWLTSDSIMNTINNKLIQKLVQTEDKLKDNFILIGAIGGIIAGIASVIILLKQFNVI